MSGIVNFLTLKNIAFHAVRDHLGCLFVLVPRSDTLPVIRYVRSPGCGPVCLLSKNTVEESRHAEEIRDVELIRSIGILFSAENCVVLLCDVLEDGRWRTFFRDAPISRICAPANNVAQDWPGHFLSDHNIAYCKEPQDLRMRNCLAPESPENIDAVYTWVDSGDTRWKLKKSFHSHSNGVHSADNSDRYRSRDELRYSIRSIRENAPWLRHIFVVTDQQQPDWFYETEGITIVDHGSIFPDRSVLPVFNSHAIEANLHRIEGLSEFFIYFNDDIFLGQPVSKEHFFDDKGRSLIYASQASFIDITLPTEQMVPTDFAAANMQAIFLKDFGFVPTRKMMHTPHPLRRSIMQEIWKKYRAELLITSSNRIRSVDDIAVPSMFYPYYAWATGRAVTRTPGSTSYTYFDTGKSDFRAVSKRLVKKPPHFFCANATHFEEIDPDVQEELLQKLLSRLYPDPSPFELSPPAEIPPRV